MDSEDVIVYVQLMDEGTRVFRPTKGVLAAHDTCKLLATPDYDPADEAWEFPPGSVVRCEIRRLNGEDLLVAVAPA